MIGFSKILTGKATVAATIQAEAGHCVPAHLLQFSTVNRPVVVWNLTRSCNLRCRHCYIEAGEGEFSGELSTAEGIELVHQLADLQIPVLLLSGGEPLLRRDIWQLALEARESGIRTALSTNGTLITVDVAKKIRDCGIAYVGVSIDGREETHDRFRGVPGSFARALEGLRTARAAGLNTGIRFTVNKDNYNDLPYLMQLVKEEQIPRLCLYHLVYAGRGKEIAASDLSMSEKRDFVAYIIEQALAMANAGVELEVLTTDHHADGIYLKQWIDQHLPERSADVEQLLIRHGGCSAGVKMANIDPQGYVYPCQFWRSSSLGKFPEKSFQAIWWNENNKLLQALRHKCDYLKGRCGQCQHNNLCGGCRIRAEAITGDLWESDPVCYLTDQEIGIGQ